MQPKFIHLHLHTEYSIVDGIVRIKPLIDACVANNMPAVAITDRCNFFGLVKFYKAAMAAGIKPIIGVDVLLRDVDTNQPFVLTLLCQNKDGYKNLIQLVSRAYTKGQHAGVPFIERSWLEQANEGIIVLSGGCYGDIGRALLANKIDKAESLLARWMQYFPQRFYLELQRTGHLDEETYIYAALDLAHQVNNPVPVVATNDVHFLVRDDYEAHEARVCIHDGYVLEDPKRPRIYNEQQYLRSPEEMIELFADIPEAIANSVEIAKRCNVELTLGEAFLPQFPIPANMTLETFFEHQVRQGLKQRQLKMDSIYEARLQYEIKVINQMGYAGYFLIVADFVHWAKTNNIPVGPGRGSGAGSLVAYALAITDVDPMQHELLFERFLNPERVSMPDFDIDFCMEGRDRVIDYVAERYGRDSVSQIITFGTMAAKAVVRDVGRVLAHPYGYVDKIAKLIPFELGMTLEKALQQEERLAELYNKEDEVKTLIDLAKKLEGVTRNAGKHAGGVVISPSLLTDFTPLYCEEGGKNLVSQFDKNDVEAVGLVKFDFLGLRTLTIINWALQTINIKRKQQNDKELDITKIPLDDPIAYKLLKSCNTTAIFQLESRGMRDLVRRLQPDCFSDIVALVALFRPGPLQSGMVDDFIERKHGRAAVAYPHPAIKSILAPTYGVILYQEQVMQIAQTLAGYSLGAADLLRRAMGKKKPEAMAKQRAVFMEGAVANKVDKYVANSIFDLMEKFAGYGFNKSHSVGYALIAYQTAWLKAHYPAEFMAAVLSSDMDNTDKVVLFVNECENLGLKLIAPHINHSQYKFTVNSNGEIIYGLGAIKGVGYAAISIIIAAREQDGDFKDMFEFCQRMDTRKTNKRVLEALVCSGALDELGPNRATMFASIGIALKVAEQYTRRQQNGQYDLFTDITTPTTQAEMFENTADWDDDKRLAAEYDALGLYLTGHPIARYEAELSKFATPIEKLSQKNNQTVIIAGFISAIKTLLTKSGKRMAVVTLADRSAQTDVTVFNEVYHECRDQLVKKTLLIIEGEVGVDNFSGGFRMQAKRVFDIVVAREEYTKYLLINIDKNQVDKDIISKLTSELKPFVGGKCMVCINYSRPEAKSKFLLGDKWKIKPTDELLTKLSQLLGKNNAVFYYV